MTKAVLAPLEIISCGGMCIPNTMNSAIEAMGMSLPYRPHFDQLFKRTGSLYKSFEGMPKIAKPEKPSDVEEAVTKAKLLHYELVHSSDSMKITSMCFWIMRSTFSACGLCICFHSYYVGLLEAYLCLEFDYFLYLNDI
ncbi:uncharacterized protein [Henckelia pumila]|uniref:uncharacterized protein isoform X2 n=1 Tax=Henckelia pumila TaxID=405737 RepID=UPI003C6E3402